MKYIDADRLREELQKPKTELKVGNYYLDNSEQAVGYENALIDFELLIDSLQQEQAEGLHFTPLNRLIQKIPSGNWNDTVNNYAKKLRDCLIEEGYRKDAEVLQGYISYMNGNNVPMATMDGQEQSQVADASKMERPVEGLEELRKEVIKFSQDHFDELHSDMETIDIVHIIACHFAEWGAAHARKEE